MTKDIENINSEANLRDTSKENKIAKLKDEIIVHVFQNENKK